MMSKNKPLILVVNDDGMFSPGIQFLSSVMGEIGDVFVIAPTINRSGASHAMTLNQDIYINNGGNQSRAFTYIDDVIDAFDLLFKNSKCLNNDFNIGNIKETSINDLAKLVLKVSLSPPLLLVIVAHP